jgi:hypothetical protein
MKRARLGGRAGPAAALGAAALAAVWLSPETRPPVPLVEDGDERLDYSVSVMGIRAGTITLRTRLQDGSGAPPRAFVEMEMGATEFFSRFCCVRERAVSEVDPSGPFSVGYRRTKGEGEDELADTYEFDYDARVVRFTRRESGRESSRELSLPGPAQDAVSWLHYVRVRVASGERHLRFLVAGRKGCWEAELDVVGSEEIDLGALGRLKALRAVGGSGLGETLGGGSDREGGEPVVLWLDPATGILLKASVPAKFGRMGLALTGARNAPAIGGLEGAP